MTAPTWRSLRTSQGATTSTTTAPITAIARSAAPTPRPLRAIAGTPTSTAKPKASGRFRAATPIRPPSTTTRGSAGESTTRRAASSTAGTSTTCRLSLITTPADWYHIGWSGGDGGRGQADGRASEPAPEERDQPDARPGEQGQRDAVRAVGLEAHQIECREDEREHRRVLRGRLQPVAPRGGQQQTVSVGERLGHRSVDDRVTRRRQIRRDQHRERDPHHDRRPDDQEESGSPPTGVGVHGAERYRRATRPPSHPPRIAP